MEDQDNASKDVKKENEANGESQSLFQQVQRMSVTEKAMLARKGDKEARTLLIRDSNKTIQLAVIGNDRITEEEVAAIANSKSVEEEVLRRVATKREWMKVHGIRAALAKNPKTPVNIAAKLVPTLMLEEVKKIAKSKNVSSTVAQAARRHIVSKGA